MTSARKLRDLIEGPEILMAPGIYDALSGVFVERSGFGAAYLSGASIAYTQFGRPDIGLVTMSEVASSLARISERIDIPVIVDADTGFGNAINVQRTVRVFERMGAAAIQIEDQTMPKRCGHLSGKTLIPATEMAGKIKAALDARASDETLIIARTDAVAVEGLSAALDRAACYAEAGADVLFVEAPSNRAQLSEIARRLKGLTPLLSNMVEGGLTPQLPAAELEKIGFSIVIFPGAFVRAYCAMAQEFFATLRRDGSTEAFRPRMIDFNRLNELLDTQAFLDLGARYEAGEA